MLTVLPTYVVSKTAYLGCHSLSGMPEFVPVKAIITEKPL